jgi:hypothetical protein
VDRGADGGYGCKGYSAYDEIGLVQYGGSIERIGEQKEQSSATRYCDSDRDVLLLYKSNTQLTIGNCAHEFTDALTSLVKHSF